MDSELAAREKRLHELVVKYAKDNPGYRMAAWLLDHGAFFAPAPLPAGIERGDMGTCDVNTLFVVVPRGKASLRRLHSIVFGRTRPSVIVLVSLGHYLDPG